MAIRPFDFYVEMEKNDYTPVGEVKQLDTMELDIKVLENGVPKDLESSEIALYVRKKDGTILEQKDNINIVEASEGTIKIKVKNQATACVGMALFELELKGNDGIATTGTFIFIVNERVVNGEVVESKDEIHALVEVEKYVKLAKEELQRFKELQAEMLRTNETINLNEEGRVSAEEKRVNAEKKRALAEEERGTLFTQKEEERGTLFAQKEVERDNTFAQGERERNERFEEAESDRAVAESERVIAEQVRKEKFAEFESKISSNAKELKGARTATTGENFDTLDERIDCEVDRLNKKIEVSMLQQEDKEIHIIENTVEGVTSDMVVRGRTLQNLIVSGKRINVIDRSIDPNSRIYSFKVPYNLQRGKRYEGYIKIDNIESSKYGLRLYGLGFGDGGGYYSIGNKAGIYKFTWNTSTAPESIKEFYTVAIYLDNEDFTNGGKATFSDFMLFEEGTDLNAVNEYFEGVKSFGQQEDKISILTTGANLLDKTKLLQQGTNNPSGYLINGERITFKATGGFYFKIKLEKGEVYYLSSISNNINNIRIYKDTTFSGSPIAQLGSNSTYTHNVETGFYYLRIWTNEIDSYVENMQFESKNKTPYQSYKEDKKDILLSQYGFDEGLRGLNNSVYDELSSIRNVAVKRVGKYTMTGNEQLTGGLRSDFIYCSFKLEGTVPRSGTEAICNQFIYIDRLWDSEHPSANGKEGFDLSGSDVLSFQLPISKLETPNTDGIKKYFKSLYDSGNPVIVYYELAEPVETPLDENINLKVFNEKTYVNFENALSGTSSFKVPVDNVLSLSNLTDGIRNKIDKKEADEIDERASKSLMLSKHNFADTNDNIFPYIMDLELMILDMMELNGYTNKKYKIMERAGINMTSKQALERLIRQKKVTLEDALDRIVRYNDAGRITDAEALELTDLANEIL